MYINWQSEMKGFFLRSSTNYILLLLLIVFTFPIYLKLIITDPIIGRDDLWLLDPLQQIKSFNDFFSYYAHFISADFQPIRDLSYLLDIKIKNITGIGIHHFTNWLIWLTIIFYLWFTSKSKKNAVYFIILLLLAVNPLVTTSVGWNSARKHLLACLFGVMTLRNYLDTREKNINKRTIFYYILTVLSQPIFILFPLWVLLYECLLDWSRIMKKFTIPLILTLLMIGFLIINYFYYSSYYERTNELVKLGGIHPSEFNSPIEILMRLGHYIYNLVLPHDLSFYYNPDALISFLGILFLLVIFYVSFKLFQLKKTLLFLALLLLPLFLPLLKIRVIYISDTYLILPLIIMFNGLAIFIERIKIDRHYILFSFVFLIPLSFVTAKQEAGQWESTKELWKKNFLLYPSCESSLSYSLVLFLNKDFDEAVQASRLYWRLNCSNVNKGYLLYLLNLYHDRHSDLNDRISAVLKIKQGEEFSHLILANLYLLNNMPDKAFSTLSEIKKNKNLFPLFFKEYQKPFIEFCHLKQSRDCDWLNNDFLPRFEYESKTVFNMNAPI